MTGPADAPFAAPPPPPQLDMFIFTVAFFHIFVSVLTVMVAHFRVWKWWTPWNQDVKDDNARL